MDLTHSRHLTCIPDLSRATNLERLDLVGCTSLTEIPSSIQHLVKLVVLDLQVCANLRKFPASSDSIKHLLLSYCSKLKAFPISSSMELLSLRDTAVEVLPSNFERLSRLRSLCLGGNSRLTCLPDSICRLTSLETLDISGCSKLDRLPEELGNLENLQTLHANGVPLKKMPSSMSRLKNLRYLTIQRPKRQGQPSLQLPPLSEFHQLRSLYLDNCGFTELPEGLGLLSSVESLTLRGNNLENIPESITHLSSLRHLDISYCERLQSLPESITHLSSLHYLDIRRCERLQSLPESITHLSSLRHLDISHCERLQSLPELPRSLGYLQAVNCKSLQAVSNLSTLPANLTFDGMEFSFFNCVNLNRNAIRDIVKNVLLKILSKECARDERKPCSSYINFPGDEIPEWFRYQGLGSFIVFKLPPDWFNDAFFGFALCIVVACSDHHDKCTTWSAKFECKVKLPNGEWFLLPNDRDLCHLNHSMGNGPSYVGVDNVLLKFFEVQRSGFCGKYFSDEISFGFYLEPWYRGTRKHTNCKHTNCYKVKKCGVSLMYKQDFVTSGESFNFDDNCFWKSTEESSTSRRFRFEEEEQKELDPKRLKLN